MSAQQVVPIPVPTTEDIQQYLDDNDKLIQAILDNLNAGRLQEGLGYQQRLQQNLMYLAAVADAQQQPASQQQQQQAQHRREQQHPATG